MKMRKTRTTIAVIGEGPTEKYYLKSLEGVIHAQVKPVFQIMPPVWLNWNVE